MFHPCPFPGRDCEGLARRGSADNRCREYRNCTRNDSHSMSQYDDIPNDSVHPEGTNQTRIVANGCATGGKSTAKRELGPLV